MHRIMLVEDDAETRHAAAAALHQAEYEVETCSEPCAAFDRACEFSPDALILDVSAAHSRASYRALDHLKQQEETNSIPVLLAVARPGALELDQQTLVERGVHVLPRPLRPTDLIRRVHEVLDRQHRVPGDARGGWRQ